MKRKPAAHVHGHRDRSERGNTLTFSAGNLPTGATLNATGVFCWTPSFTQGGSNYNVTITVTDNGSPAASDSETSPSPSATSTGHRC